MTEKDLSREIIMAETIAERGRQVLQQSQRIAKLEQERDSLSERIREMEAQKECAHSASIAHD